MPTLALHNIVLFSSVCIITGTRLPNVVVTSNVTGETTDDCTDPEQVENMKDTIKGSVPAALQGNEACIDKCIVTDVEIDCSPKEGSVSPRNRRDVPLYIMSIYTHVSAQIDDSSTTTNMILGVYSLCNNLVPEIVPCFNDGTDGPRTRASRNNPTVSFSGVNRECGPGFEQANNNNLCGKYSMNHETSSLNLE